MLTFDFKNVFSVGDHGLLKEPDMSWFPQPSGKRYSFYDLPENGKLADEIAEFAREAREKFDHFVLLGIGGSALGARCIADALASASERGRLIILDNVDPALLSNATAGLDLARTLFLVVSKSGGTPETVAQYFYFREKTEATGLKATEHFVFVTDPEKGFLRKIAREEKIRSFEIPPEVGGRFSVLSACGLLPAALLGIDIHGLLRGAARQREGIFHTSFQENHAYQLAAIQYLLWKERGVPMTVIMPYSSQLSTFSDWYVQLLSESIGKEKNLRGETVNVGLTPVKAVGVTDQHAQVQLFTSGPFDKFLLFIEVSESDFDLKIPVMYESEKDFSYLHGVSFHQLLLTEKRATEQALTQYGRPNATVKISKLDSEHLGMLFMLFQESVAFLGELCGIDAFDQPGVELGKVLTKRLLS
ncbi:MAG: glucose-6-phosphate isomerase [Patescibacteria group bacterium]